MLQKHKQPSLEAGLMIVDKVDNFTQLVVLIVISIFSFGYYSENRVTGMASTQVTGNMVKVTGMDLR